MQNFTGGVPVANMPFSERDVNAPQNLFSEPKMPINSGDPNTELIVSPPSQVSSNLIQQDLMPSQTYGGLNRNQPNFYS